MKKYKAKTLLLNAFVAGMVGTFCLSGCGKVSAEIPVKQSEIVQEQPVKIAKLSMDRAAVSLLSDSAGEQKTVSKKIQALIEPSTAKNVTVDWSVEWGEKQKAEVTDYLTISPENGCLHVTVAESEPSESGVTVR